MVTFTEEILNENFIFVQCKLFMRLNLDYDDIVHGENYNQGCIQKLFDTGLGAQTLMTKN